MSGIGYKSRKIAIKDSERNGPNKMRVKSVRRRINNERKGEKKEGKRVSIYTLYGIVIVIPGTIK